MKKKLQKISLLVSGLALAATLTAFFSVSFAWFTHKRNAAIDKPETEVVGQLQVNYLTYLDGSTTPYSGQNIVYDNLIPGQNRRTVKIEITNTGELPTIVNLAFLAPTIEQEVPFVDTAGDYGTPGYYYYFGSQIKIENTVAKVNNTAVNLLNPVDDFLVTTQALGKGQVNGVAAAVGAIPELEILEDVNFQVGDVITVEYTILFVDNNTNQNVFVEAWPATGVSYRTFKIHLKEGVAA